MAAVLLVFGAVRLPIETRLNEEYRAAFFHGAKLNLGLRQQIGQLGFLAALGGFRALVADGLWIQAHIDWTRTEWGRMLFLFNNVTALQPRNIMFWEMSAWHMAYNASVAAIEDTRQPRVALRLKHQHEYFLIGKDLLERGIAEQSRTATTSTRAWAMFCATSSRIIAPPRSSSARPRNSRMPPTYEPRFAAYELSYCPGHDREAYNELLRLYQHGRERMASDPA